MEKPCPYRRSEKNLVLSPNEQNEEAPPCSKKHKHTHYIQQTFRQTAARTWTTADPKARFYPFHKGQQMSLAPSRLPLPPGQSSSPKGLWPGASESRRPEAARPGTADAARRQRLRIAGAALPGSSEPIKRLLSLHECLIRGEDATLPT